MPTQLCTATRHCSNHQKAISNLGAAEYEETQWTDLVVIGNGPSGITLSYMLSGHWPYYKGGSSDEFLDARLKIEPNLSLIEQDLQFLSDGLEGRSNNPVSLLFDALQKPEADLGMEESSLLEWRLKKEKHIDHVVLGRGKPGGIWQSLNGELLTVSLGSWMELPDLTMSQWMESNGLKKTNSNIPSSRTTVANVSKYYMDFLDIMGIAENFRNFTVVTEVKQVKLNESWNTLKHSSVDVNECLLKNPKETTDDVFSFDTNDSVPDDLSSQCSSLTQKRSLSSSSVDSCCWQNEHQVFANEPRLDNEEVDTDIFSSDKHIEEFGIECIDSRLPNWDSIIHPEAYSSSHKQYSRYNCISATGHLRKLSDESNVQSQQQGMDYLDQKDTLFEVNGYEVLANADGSNRIQPFTYLTKRVVLATGQTDSPNKLDVPGEDLPFVLHSLQQLEELVKSRMLAKNMEPVMIVGAGLSAADAIISAQSHGLPVVHVFRKSVKDPALIFNKLPMALYPEYHTIHKMMIARKDVAYNAFSETEIVEIHNNGEVCLKGLDLDHVVKVSFIIVLIGSSPNLSFLSEASDIEHVDGSETHRKNLIDIDAYTHESTCVPGLYAMGPLTGDNFVRFLQGGALAITANIHNQISQHI